MHGIVWHEVVIAVWHGMYGMVGMAWSDMVLVW